MKKPLQVITDQNEAKQIKFIMKNINKDYKPKCNKNKLNLTWNTKIKYWRPKRGKQIKVLLHTKLKCYMPKHDKTNQIYQ